jgi:FkbM family methyltransferase
MPFVSYAQNFEDVLLHRVFGGQGTGFYVDVGAYHPVSGSVTKAFYDRGWSGINIEPGSVFAELLAARPRDVNLQIAILDHAGEVGFVEEKSDLGTSHIAFNGNGAGATRMVPCDTLEAVVRTHAHGRPVDFVKIDAEGSEAAIVRSTDWRRLRPRVLLLEATLPWSSALANQDWEPTLLEQGYVRAYFDGINCFYVPEEETPALLAHFGVPVNVLDLAVRYDAGAEAALAALTQERDRLHADYGALGQERDALAETCRRLQDDVARLDAESRAAAEAREAAVARCAALAAERDAGIVRRDAIITERNEAIAERDALAAERDAAIAERDTIATERDAAIAGRDVLAAERAALAAERDSMIEALCAAEAPTAAPAPEVAANSEAPRDTPSRRSFAHRAARAAARAAYKVVRPVVRPVAWRARGFMISGLGQYLEAWQNPLLARMSDLGRALTALTAMEKATLAGLDARLQHPLAPVPDLHRELTALPVMEKAALAGLTTMANRNDPVAETEMRRLADAMERTLLTLAMERAPDHGRAAVRWQPEPEPGSPQHVTLLLPRGRATDVECVPGDLSVAAALRASGGEWEPHVRRYMEGIVRPDWVCLDIGANIGAHTLSMAALACEGRVVAFEADAVNFAVLSRNADALAPPRGTIELVHVALWDRPGTLILGGADELAGCSFVAEDGADAAAVERRLRRVVDPDAIKRTDIHARVSEVPALPLDAWAKDNPLARLDLIKLDVRGAEVRVLHGAEATLRRYRPVLVVEYNPACAEVYFGQPPDALFRELDARFATIYVLEADGSLTLVPGWDLLGERLDRGKGWEDLVCIPGRDA